MTPVSVAARAWRKNERRTAVGSESGSERREARQRPAAAGSHCLGSSEEEWEEGGGKAAARGSRRGSRGGLRADATMGSV